MNIGIDTGGTSTRVWDGKDSIKIPTPFEYDEYIALLVETLKPYNSIDTLVISLPAVIEDQKVVKIPNLSESWLRKDIQQDIKGKLNVKKVIIIQDTEAAGYAVQGEELIGDGPALFLTLSTGVGGALVTKDIVLPLEIGHMVLNLSGKHSVCGCGQIGCAEADLSGTAIYKAAGIKAEELVDAAFWKKYGEELGQFLLVLTAMFKLRQIVFSGGVSTQMDKFISETKKVLEERLKNIPVPSLQFSQLGDNTGAHGAYWLATKV